MSIRFYIEAVSPTGPDEYHHIDESQIPRRCEPAHVLLTFAAYRKLTAQRSKIADLLAMPAEAEVELPLATHCQLARAADPG